MFASWYCPLHASQPAYGLGGYVGGFAFCRGRQMFVYFLGPMVTPRERRLGSFPNQELQMFAHPLLCAGFYRASRPAY